MENEVIIYKRYRCKEVFCTVCGKSIIKQLGEISRKEKNKIPIVCKQCTLTIRNKSGLVKNCTNCGVLLTLENEVRYGKNKESKRHSVKCKTCFKLQTKERYWETKLKVINHYGGKCVCCGETTPEFLTVDHINNDGKDHRRKKQFSLGKNLYYTLIRENFNVGYALQLLCWNCNEAKNYYGICPHQK